MDVHGDHGAVRRRASAVLGGFEHTDDLAAEVALQPPSCDERGGRQVSFDEDQIEIARKLFAGPISFLKSAPDLKFLPDPAVPEVAFAGRSNVGKSSLLNALTGRNGLARTSNTPGRTQELKRSEAHPSEIQSLMRI